MGKTIEVRLSDAQHAQLVAEAEASGDSFFGYCRSKLTTQLLDAFPLTPANPAPRVTIKPTADDRIARIEDAVARLSEIVLQGHQPVAAQEAQPAEPFDVEDLVNEQFAEAEASGLTERIPDEVEEVMAQSGMRPLSRRPIRFSTTPRHLQGLG